MGIDLDTYRARIGCYRMPLAKPRKVENYNPNTSGDDVHLRAFIVCIYALLVVSTTLGVLILQRHAENSLISSYSSASIEIYHQECVPNLSYQTCVKHQINHVPSADRLYVAYAQRILLLSSDIELNPGPFTGNEHEPLVAMQLPMQMPSSPDTQRILYAISCSTGFLT